jgi:acetyl-CoA C-acetyltransferase
MVDSIPEDGLCDVYSGKPMGQCAEACASRFGISREEQDVYAAESFRRANAAQLAGDTAAETVAVEFSNAKGVTIRIERDEVPSRVDYAKIPLLRPAFAKEGTITAANASGLNDGGAALVLGSGEMGVRLKAQPVARIVSWAAHSQEPLWFTTAPVPAAQKALTRAGWKTTDVDLWEVNEAFAVVPIFFAREWGIPRDKMNIRGGAISLGHPIGASGARIMVTLIEALRSRGQRRGVAAICVGGGEGLAMCIEIIEPK